MIRNTIDYCDDLSLLIDRKKRTQPNGLIIGSSGSGKTILAKQEIIDVFLKTADDIIICCDSEREYLPLVQEFNGQVIELSFDSSQHINPMDITIDIPIEETYRFIEYKSDFLQTFCELIIGGGLEPTERSIIDKCVKRIYKKFFENEPTPDKMPILSDLYRELKSEGEIAVRLCYALDIYVNGILKIFNHHTNIASNRVICFDVGKLFQYCDIGMLFVSEFVWNKIKVKTGKCTRYYLEEIYCLFKEEATAKYIAQLWVNARTNNCIITAITQNLEDLFSSEELKSIVYNVGFIYLLNQRRENREILVEKLGLSENLIESVINIEFGRGIVICGDTVLPLDVRIQPDTKLYNLLISNSWNG